MRSIATALPHSMTLSYKDNDPDQEIRIVCSGLPPIVCNLYPGIEAPVIVEGTEMHHVLDWNEEAKTLTRTVKDPLHKARGALFCFICFDTPN